MTPEEFQERRTLVLSTHRERVEREAPNDISAFHKLIPIGTPCLWKNAAGFMWRGVVIGGKQRSISYTHEWGKQEIPGLNIMWDGACEMTIEPENEMEYYLEGRWMDYTQVMRRIVK